MALVVIMSMSDREYSLFLEVIQNKKTTALARSVLHQNAQNIFRKLAHDYPVKTYTEDVYESFVLDYRNT